LIWGRGERDRERERAESEEQGSSERTVYIGGGERASLRRFPGVARSSIYYK